MKRIVVPLLCLVAAACASYDGRNLRPGVSTEAEVRSAMGPPALELESADGRRLAYPRGPLGTQTFMADIGKDGVLLGVRQVLNDDVFRQIHAGMTRDEILRAIGPPGDTMGFKLSGNVAWDYRYVDTWGYQAIFSVTFDRNWIVVSKFSQRVERDRSRN